MTPPSPNAAVRPAAVVTGGTRGIGRAIAEALASEGFRVAVTGRRARGDVAKTLDELSAACGHDVVYAGGDLGDRDARGRVFQELRDELGSLSCWVNNAGMAPPQRVDVMQSTEDSFEQVVRTNLQAAHFLTRDAAAWMLENPGTGGFRSIVNITSVSAETVSFSRGEYCLAKAALRMSTQLFAARLAGEGIGVYEVAPGVIATDMTAGVRDKYDAAIADGLIPQGRWGQPSDVAAAVAACAGGRLPYAAGTVLRVDGGLSIPRL